MGASRWHSGPVLCALGAAGVKPLAIFNNTEFLMLTLISMTQAMLRF